MTDKLFFLNRSPEAVTVLANCVCGSSLVKEFMFHVVRLYIHPAIIFWFLVITMLGISNKHCLLTLLVLSYFVFSNFLNLKSCKYFVLEIGYNKQIVRPDVE